MILMVAGGYIVVLGLVEGARGVGAIDTLMTGEVVRQITTVASLSVGAVLGFYIASHQRQS